MQWRLSLLWGLAAADLGPHLDLLLGGHSRSIAVSGSFADGPAVGSAGHSKRASIGRDGSFSPVWVGDADRCLGGGAVTDGTVRDSHCWGRSIGFRWCNLGPVKTVGTEKSGKMRDDADLPRISGGSAEPHGGRRSVEAER